MPSLPGQPRHREAHPATPQALMTAAPSLDVITLGRASVDLYGQQIGGRLEDMASFAKSVGGSPTNIAIGAARLGLKSGLITRVGKEQFGAFIRSEEHTSELQSLMRISYAVFCLKKKNNTAPH